MSAEEKEKMRKAMELDADEENDPNAYLDYLRDPVGTALDDDQSQFKEPKSKPQK